MQPSKLNKVFVINDGSGQYRKWVEDNGWEVATSDTKLSKIAFVLFTGGADVDPSVYNDTKHAATRSNIQRDRLESGVFDNAVKQGVPMVGICRGAQLLCALNGGSIIQHVTGHNKGNHLVTLSSGKTISVTSTHHQMMDPKDGASLLAWSTGLSDKYEISEGRSKNILKEPEAVAWKKTRCLGVQWHPELMDTATPGNRIVQYWINNLVAK